MTTRDNDIRSRLADIVDVSPRDDGTWWTAIEDEGDGEDANAVLAEINAALKGVAVADWTGDGNTDADGTTTSDVRIEWIAEADEDE